jgi:hypothetical protein
VYWLQRPPYARWALAVLLIVGAAVWDLRSTPSTLHPFLTEGVAAGDPITEEHVEWREIPSGLVVAPDLTYPVAGIDIPAGEPLLDSMLRGPVAIPNGWWEVPAAIGAHADAGDEVLLVVVDPPTTVMGIVVSPQRGDAYSLDYRPASVAVPLDAAPLIAAASAQGSLVAAVRPAGG